MHYRLVFIASLFLLHADAEARWATKDDQGSLVKKYYTTYKIKKDGTYIRTTEQEIEILRDDARVSDGLVRFKYKPDSENFQILEAYTMNGDKREDVPADTIEDKPLASDGEGFDQTNQITLVFPDVRIGSKLYFKAQRNYEVPQIEGFFSEYLFLGGDYFHDVKIQIDSELPLYADFTDPSRDFRINRSRHHITLKNRRPVLRKVIDETDAILTPNTYPWILVSTSNSWGKFAESIIAEHEKILSAPLPKAFNHILENARTKKTPEAQINSVTSELANFLRYHGDWRSVRGRNIPRELSLVAKTRFGDCKDFSALTTIILRRLGIQADMAWTNRSLDPDFTPEGLPHFFFNHAIVRAVSNEKVYWIDPTNVASFAQGIFEDIIDRPAFVLNSAAAHLERIPKADPFSSGIDEFQEIRFGNHPKVTGKIKFSGREASFEAGLARESSPESIKHLFIDYITRDTPVRSWRVGSFDLRDRITKDIQLPYEFSPKNVTINTTAGRAFRIPAPRRLNGLFELKADRISSFFVSQPITILSEIQLKDVKVVGVENLNCKIDSPWISATRVVRKLPTQAHIMDRVLFLKPIISTKEIASDAFIEFQQELIQCFKSNIIVFRQS